MAQEPVPIQVRVAPPGVRVIVEEDDEEDEKREQLPDFWIGVGLREPDAALLAQLKLEHGVVVNEVFPESPAAKAGLKPHDVITKAGDAKISSGADLMKAIAAAKGTELSLAVVREGKSETLKLTPAKRPEERAPAEGAVPARVAPLTAEAERELERALRAWKDARGALELELVHPGVIARVEAAQLPDDMKITFERQGKQPPKVTVQQGDKTFTATNEKELESLPEAARPHARHLLGLQADRLFAFGPPGGAPPVAVPVPPRMQLRDPRAMNPLQRIEDELKQLRKDVEELRKDAAAKR
jgi:membrane-associated protease RseP (regulator of RpoE activity)